MLSQTIINPFKKRKGVVTEREPDMLVGAKWCFFTITTIIMSGRQSLFVFSFVALRYLAVHFFLFPA